MSRLRVGLFTNNYLPMLGGVATAVETLRACLEELGHEVVVVAPGPRAATDDTRRVIRVPAVPAPTYPDFSLPLPASPAMRREIAGLALDVFHAHHPFLLGATARRLAAESRRPLVFTHHTLYEKYAHYVPLPRGLVARAAIRWSTRFANHADRVVAPSAGLGARLRAQGVRRPIEVIPTGVDLARFRPGSREAARHALALPSDGPLFLYSGRLDPEKNLDLVLAAFDRVARRHPTARLALVGRGTRSAALRSRAAQGATGARIHFLGGVVPAELPRHYQAADAFVFASTTETQGLAVLEALAVGLPVVAVRASGVEEVVADGVGGLLVPEDAGAFADAMLAVAGDPGLAAKLSSGARETAWRFAAPALGARLAALYARLVGDRP